MFRALVLTIVWTAAALGAAPTTEQTRAVLARLGREADQFERNAHRFVGVETLEQVQPEGTRYSVSKRGVETRLPATKNVVVSEYGFISSDEPGGSHGVSLQAVDAVRVGGAILEEPGARGRPGVRRPARQAARQGRGWRKGM